MNPRRLATAFCAAIICSAAMAGVAHAATVGCGDVITESITLSADVGPCPGDGIVIGAHDVTLNLGGHSVTGTGTGSGILVSTFSRAHVLNGTVTGFSDGVVTRLSFDNVFEALVVKENQATGILLTLGGDNQVRRNIVTANGGNGIGSAAAGGNVIESNVVHGNAGAGVFLGRRSLNFASGRNRVAGNTIAENGGDGVFVSNFNSHNQILGNLVASNRGDGVQISVFSGDQCCNLIQGNVIRGNAENGVLILGNRPFPAPPSSLNRVLTNTAVGNGAYDLADETPGCGDNVWAGNSYGTRNQPCVN